MYFTVRHLLRKYRLKKHAGNAGTGFIPLSKIHSAVILLDGTEQDCRECESQFNAFFAEKGISADFLYLDLRRTRKEVERYAPEDKAVFKKDISWAGIPKKKRFSHLFSTETDLFINMIPSDAFTVDFFSKAVRAKFKIGAKAYDGATFDMTVESNIQEINEENRSDSLKRVGKIIGLLKTIV